MQFWNNINNMQDIAFFLLKRGLQLSTLLLAIGCAAILQESWRAAVLFREISQSILLLSIAGSCYIEANK